MMVDKERSEVEVAGGEARNIARAVRSRAGHTEERRKSYCELRGKLWKSHS